MPAGRKLYLVVRHISAARYGLYAGKAATDGEPVAAFDTEERAIGEACRLEKEARRVLPPFLAGSRERWHSEGLPALIAGLERLGLRGLPAPAIASWKAEPLWRRWWDEHGGELAPE